MISVTINNKTTAVERGTTILNAAAALGIKIPTLCNHELLEPYGACRLCLVEVIDGDWSTVTTSCNYPITKALKVETQQRKGGQGPAHGPGNAAGPLQYFA